MTIEYFNLHRHSPPEDPEESSIINLFPEDAPPEKDLYSVGLHPWHIVEDRMEKDLALVLEKGSNAVAIGECGLDRVCKVPFEVQMRGFRAQVDITEKLGKPLIIHCVRAYPDIISEKKKKWDIAPPWIIHGFRGNSETAVQLLKHGFYLSFGEAILKDGKLCDVLKAIPVDRLFLETDDKGRDVREIYEKAAEVLGFRVGKLAEFLLANAGQVFKGIANAGLETGAPL
ncbi:MAG TPA: hydrolase TatD [Lentisphaeria bacterium]|nr:hydrolase TatD [Lentisphaeria bacterium]